MLGMQWCLSKKKGSVSQKLGFRYTFLGILFEDLFQSFHSPLVFRDITHRLYQDRTRKPIKRNDISDTRTGERRTNAFV